MWWLLLIVLVVGVIVHDLLQRKHAVLRNFPLIGHGRYLIEKIGPELRQYVVASDTEERPFSREQRAWVYRSSKGEPTSTGFGTAKDLEQAPGHIIIKHAAFPYPSPDTLDRENPLPCAKVLGEAHARRGAFRPASVVNISGMSYGALSGAAVEALNRGARAAGCLHNTGEGGLFAQHRHGADLIFQIGTGYFGCRDREGNFSLETLQSTIADAPVRALEIKLSQGAKPGLGGHLPAKKITAEIAAARGIPMGRDAKSPSRHTAFHDVESLVAFVEMLATATGLPVGIKSAVGQIDLWVELAEHMVSHPGTGVDFITIDGGEGGTGAAPPSFVDHVSLPFKLGFARVYEIFWRAGLHDDIVFIGSGKLGLPDAGLSAFALGADMINVGREALLAIGCIQAQRCHTDHCPTGVATQNTRLARGLDPTLKSLRAANYLRTLRGELLSLSRTCGVAHPGLVSLDHLEFLREGLQTQAARELFGYPDGCGNLALPRRRRDSDDG